jgi:hypothetical protein
MIGIFERLRKSDHRIPWQKSLPLLKHPALDFLEFIFICKEISYRTRLPKRYFVIPSIIKDFLAKNSDYLFVN